MTHEETLLWASSSMYPLAFWPAPENVLWHWQSGTGGGGWSGWRGWLINSRLPLPQVDGHLARSRWEPDPLGGVVGHLAGQNWTNRAETCYLKVNLPCWVLDWSLCKVSPCDSADFISQSIHHDITRHKRHTNAMLHSKPSADCNTVKIKSQLFHIYMKLKGRFNCIMSKNKWCNILLHFSQSYFKSP